MKWITRERAKVDRVACPWLIKKFIDTEAEFYFVPADSPVFSGPLRATPALLNMPFFLSGGLKIICTCCSIAVLMH